MKPALPLLALAIASAIPLTSHARAEDPPEAWTPEVTPQTQALQKTHLANIVELHPWFSAKGIRIDRGAPGRQPDEK